MSSRLLSVGEGGRRLLPSGAETAENRSKPLNRLAWGLGNPLAPDFRSYKQMLFACGQPEGRAAQFVTRRVEGEVTGNK